MYKMTEQQRKKFVKKVERRQTPEQLVDGILSGSRTALSKAITLIESRIAHDQQLAQVMMQSLLPHAGKSIRIGITGVPGAGKSTFIEALGTVLCDHGHRVAVLAIDPSSTINGGSILGDKTRMELLARHPQAFIRPSPSSGTLGGVHKRSREAVIACEAAGFDIIIVETVGVGQSEAIVRGMVDVFLLLALTGAGDELQGMKKGIMELIDAIIVNKADGENRKLALKTKREYTQILHLLTPATSGWNPRAYICSSLTGEGIDEMVKLIYTFANQTKESGVFEQRRNEQIIEWLYSMVKDRLETKFFEDENVKRLLPTIESDIKKGMMTVPHATNLLFNAFQRK
ncbi:methylmalonyl Co-A mutase-associated GTPase MeaB [Bacillus sp. FJAT-50079]|uniref:methylmalonyl Co-A mutase-associated GTPase MeaB n=1 Tax=Bacillus sp. FJAT-50079 TaxID=2833577 RepID=UPI001BC9983D|nr:methylmalonyl Co-A mutase-associated GTPase MeaB [Bacillus sp. FJAT-50079]MBS4209664.1 methylmalonyl Co-A mutase-associated GTPase MeaB [Bacillus sp. FJAT-50079]